MPKKGIIKPRPHARIITMIGGQLIRNEKVALMELLKNSYDADASWVQIRLLNFINKDGSLTISKDSAIEIEDDGIGMDFDIIEKVWANPASPYKYLLKKKGKEKTAKGRIIQGEKGIGRFAVFKLGTTVEIFTRAKNKNTEEIYLKSDLSIYDEELINRKNIKSKEPVFIDDIEYAYERGKAKKIKEQEILIYNRKIQRPPYGTLIRITNLSGYWTLDKIKNIFQDSLKLMSPFNKKADFTCHITLNEDTLYSGFKKDALADILSMAPIFMNGQVDKDGNVTYALNRSKKKNSLSLRELSVDGEVKKHFCDKKGQLIHKPESGPFNFKLYVFDIDRKTSLESPLKDPDIEIIKSHRIYLYRDGVRIYPYGDPSDDWIELDIKRGTKRAGAYLSNNQFIGYVEITSKHNALLRDKTNREGLMDIGSAYDDLKFIVLGIMGFLRSEFQKYKIKRDEKEKGLLQKEPEVKEDIQALHKYFEDKKDSKGGKLVNQLEVNYKKEKEVLNERVEIIEDLAAVGISVDAASHDLVIMIKRAKESLNLLFEMSKHDNVDSKKVQDMIEKLRGQFAFIEDQLHGIQPLFRSSRRRSKNIRILDIIDKVKMYYSVPLKDRKVKVVVEEKGSPLVVKCSEGILLQVFINLFDNSVYWFSTVDKKDKEIRIIIDGTASEVVFADNGPGVKKGDVEFIFKPFFTTKGVSGRGLGLYITKQLLERYDFSIDYLQREKGRLLGGANFFLSLSEEEQT